eukprot:SAG11_NODE_18049_length_501_cov_1.042289_1_plen_134_part_10
MAAADYPAPQPPPEPPPADEQPELLGADPHPRASDTTVADAQDVAINPSVMVPKSQWKQVAGIDTHLRFPSADGIVANLDRAGQDPDHSRLSRTGRAKFNFRVQGDYTVHAEGADREITWLQVYEEYVAVDRIR